MNCKQLLLLALVCILPGCATLPWKDTFECPQMERGQCVSVDTAHRISKDGPMTGEQAAEYSRELDSAITAYQVAVRTGTPEEVKKRQEALLSIIIPSHSEDFNKALGEFQSAVKSGKKEAVLEAEQRLRALYESVLDQVNRSQIDYEIQRNDIRQEYLGRYAQGQKAPAIRTPPVIMETHILPYQTESGTLAGERTLWIPVEEPTWVWTDSFPGAGGNDVGTVTGGGR